MNEKRVYYFIISFLFIRVCIMCVLKKKNNVRELENCWEARSKIRVISNGNYSNLVQIEFLSEGKYLRSPKFKIFSPPLTLIKLSQLFCRSDAFFR